MTPGWKDAAEKYLKQRFPEYQKDDSVMHVDVEVFQAGAEHACEQLKHQITERDYAISSWKQEEESWNEQMMRLREANAKLREALESIASDRWIVGECQIDSFKGLDEKSIAKQALLSAKQD